MTNIKLLSDNYQVSGTDLSELRTALEEMDSITSLTKVSTLDIEILSLDRSRSISGGKTAFRVFSPLDGEMPSVGIQLDRPETEKFKTLAKETRANQLLLRVNGKILFTASDLISTMSTRAGLGGTNISRPSSRRDAYIAELFGFDEKDVKILVRKVGNIRKAFAMHSERYGLVPQVTLHDIIEKIDYGLGTPVCRYWEIDQSRSCVQLDFPERAKDFAKVYGISDRIIPGIRLMTSDVGDSSVCAIGTWRIGKGVVSSDVFSRKHVGKIDPAFILQQIERQIFARYDRIPKMLGELLKVDISDPAECLISILRQIKLEEKVGKRRLQEITDLLIAQFNPTLKYTAYDLAKTILALPDSLKGLPPSTLKTIEGLVVDAVFADYKEYETELAVIAA